MIDWLRHDLRFALRSLRRRPGFTAMGTAAALAAVATIASLLPALRAIRTDPVDALRAE